MPNAKLAADKVSNSVPKRIEDIMLKEIPERYTNLGGLRNWIVLNKDVAVVQKHLQGKLPSRDNVTKLLYEVVIKDNKTASPSSHASTATETSKITNHRMSSQKKLLTSQYAITFPTDTCDKTTREDESCSSYLDGFKLALKLQQEEMERQLPDVHVSEPFSNTVAETSTTSSYSSDLEFQANAAAALLELQRRSSDT